MSHNVEDHPDKRTSRSFQINLLIRKGKVLFTRWRQADGTCFHHLHRASTKHCLWNLCPLADHNVILFGWMILGHPFEKLLTPVNEITHEEYCLSGRAI